MTILVSLLLTACQLAAIVSVSEGPAGPVVSVRYADGDDTACMQGMSIYPVDDEAAPPLWRVSLDREDACVSRITFGQTPAGFVQDIAPLPLVPGVRYRFAVIGPGINDGIVFTPTKPFTPPSAVPAGSRSR